MHKALLFTDLHITQAGETIIGLDPLARFEMALAHALTTQPDAEHVIILGDLTHNGHPAEYARLVQALNGCPRPVTMTLGNHDDRSAFFGAFPVAHRTAQGHAQAALDLGAARLLILDTLDAEGNAPRHGGWLCDARLAWLDRELAHARGEDRPIIVLCHHPAFATGLDGMDAIGLANADALTARLGDTDIAHLICGHVHRTVQTTCGTRPAAIVKSTCHQMPLRFGPQDVHLSVDEPGGYGVLVTLGDRAVLHSVDAAPSPPDGSAA